MQIPNKSKLNFKVPIYLVAVQQTIDTNSSPNKVDELLVIAHKFNLSSEILYIDSLSTGWSTPLENNHFRSGNGPLEAVNAAVNKLNNKEVDIVVIEGEDKLKTDYTSSIRHQLMNIYPSMTLIEAYTELAKSWCSLNKLSLNEFIIIAQNLFNNYHETYIKQYGNTQINNKWYEFITPLFRGVDCANPVIDYSGKIMLTTQAGLIKLNLEKNKLISIAGIEVTNLLPSKANSLNQIQEIVKYNHLAEAYLGACNQAQINFTQLFKKNKAFLEVYTCFPVVPLAFLYKSELAFDFNSSLEIINNHALTVTGGMNLAKAPWNLPVLRAIISMYCKLINDDKISIAGIHGNGGLGEKQGFLILKSEQL